MTYSEKYQIAIKPFLKYTDCMHLLGTNSKYYKKTWNKMVSDLQKQTGKEFGVWGIPNKLVLEYIGLDVELIRLNAEQEKNRFNA